MITRARALSMLRTLETICANAKLAPDDSGQWRGAVDFYKVPLDDIEAARIIVARAREDIKIAGGDDA